MNFRSTLDRIQAEAAELEPQRVALTIVAAIPFAVGWLASKLWLVVWMVLTWLYTAALVGWRSGRGGS